MQEIRDKAVAAHGQQSLVPVENADLQRVLEFTGSSCGIRGSCPARRRRCSSQSRSGTDRAQNSASWVGPPTGSGRRAGQSGERGGSAHRVFVDDRHPAARSAEAPDSAAPGTSRCGVSSKSARTRCSARWCPSGSAERSHDCWGPGLPDPPLTDRDVDDLIKAPKAAPCCSATATAAGGHRAARRAAAPGGAAGRRFARNHAPGTQPDHHVESRDGSGGCPAWCGPAMIRADPRPGGYPAEDQYRRPTPRRVVRQCQNELMATPAPAQPTLAEAIERTGYYPMSCKTCLTTLLWGEAVQDFIVQHETTFDRADEIRRHITVLLLTQTRLLVACGRTLTASRPATSRRRQRPNPVPLKKIGPALCNESSTIQHTSGPATCPAKWSSPSTGAA